MSYDEMRFLINRAVYFINNNETFPEAFFNRLLGVAESQGDANQLCEVGLLAARRAIDQKQVAEGVGILERLLPFCGHLPQYQVGYQNYLRRAAQALEEMGNTSDDPSPYLDGYERLKQVGGVGVVHHVLAVEQFIKLSRREEALELWQILDKTAPNAPGVQYLGKVLFGTLNNSAKNKKEVPQVPYDQIDFEELSKRTQYLQEIMGAVEEGKQKEVFNRVDEILDKTPELNDKTSDFFFAAGAALYTAGRELDAFPYLHQLVERFPAYIHYQRLFLRLCNDLMSYSEMIAQQNKEAPVLLQLFNLLHDHYYAPVSLLAAVAEQRTEKSELAKELLIKRLQLSPHDSEYIGSALRVALSIKDKEWYRGLKNHLEALVAERPYDMGLQLAHRRFNFKMSPEDKGLT